MVKEDCCRGVGETQWKKGENEHKEAYRGVDIQGGREVMKSHV